MDAITIVGAGGIGCAVGYALRAAGVPVTFVDADAAKVEHGRRHGVAVDRRPPLPADFVHFHDWHPAPGTAVWLCTKCYDNAAVLARARALEAIHRDLLPLDELDLEAHGAVAEVHPYRGTARAATPFELAVDLRNPLRISQEVTARLAVPAGWLVQPGEGCVFLRSGARTTIHFTLVAPAGTRVRRARIGVEVAAGRRRLGQVAEALVDLP